MLGTIAASTTEPHEYVWGQLGHTHPGGPPDWTIFPPGSYLIIDHFNTAGTIDSDIPGIGGQAADMGDWVVAIDGDGDGMSDTFHLVRHDTRTGLPSTAGHSVGDVLGISVGRRAARSAGRHRRSRLSTAGARFTSRTTTSRPRPATVRRASCSTAARTRRGESTATWTRANCLCRSVRVPRT